jgi:hypothetical protein
LAEKYIYFKLITILPQFSFWFLLVSSQQYCGDESEQSCPSGGIVISPLQSLQVPSLSKKQGLCNSHTNKHTCKRTDFIVKVVLGENYPNLKSDFLLFFLFSFTNKCLKSHSTVQGENFWGFFLGIK